MNSFEQTLLEVAKDTMRTRLKAWLDYEWSKNILPIIIEEVTRNVRIECISNRNIPEEIRINLRFDPSVPLRGKTE